MKKVVTGIKSQEVNVKDVSNHKFYGGIFKDDIGIVYKIFIMREKFNRGDYKCLWPDWLTNGNALVSINNSEIPVSSGTISGLIQQLSNFTFYEFDTYQELFQWLSTNLN